MVLRKPCELIERQLLGRHRGRGPYRERMMRARVLRHRQPQFPLLLLRELQRLHLLNGASSLLIRLQYVRQL